MKLDQAYPAKTTMSNTPRNEIKRSCGSFSVKLNLSPERVVQLRDEVLDFTAEELSRVLSILSESKDNLLWGDLVSVEDVGSYRNQGLLIYDGEKLLQIEDEERSQYDDYGCLPKQFRVLEPHPTEGFIIPFNYWHGGYENKKDEDEFKDRKVAHNGFVWFKPTVVELEQIKNAFLRFNINREIALLFKFERQGKEYIFEFNEEYYHCDENEEDYLSIIAGAKLMLLSVAFDKEDSETTAYTFLFE